MIGRLGVDAHVVDVESPRTVEARGGAPADQDLFECPSTWRKIGGRHRLASNDDACSAAVFLKIDIDRERVANAVRRSLAGTGEVASVRIELTTEVGRVREER